MRQNWDFYLLLLAVIAWAIFKARGVWRKEQERRAMLHEELHMLEAEEAAGKPGSGPASQGAED